MTLLYEFVATSPNQQKSNDEALWLPSGASPEAIKRILAATHQYTGAIWHRPFLMVGGFGAQMYKMKMERASLQ